MRGHTRTDGMMEDYCDGADFKQHPLFSKQSTSLQIMLYYDELEICNPLGSKVKTHKLGIKVSIFAIMYLCIYISKLYGIPLKITLNFRAFFLWNLEFFNTVGILYYQVGNLSPYLRSKLISIQVVAVAKVPIIMKYGIDCILEPFINDMKKLEQVRLVTYVHSALHCIEWLHETAALYFIMIIIIKNNIIMFVIIKYYTIGWDTSSA